MISRACADAERALRLLRATLRGHHILPDINLRFRLGHDVWFDDGAKAWGRAPDWGVELRLNEALVELATSQPLSTLPAVPTNEVEQRVARALRWYESAQLAVDPVMKLLALFFALETILGDKSEGLKAPALAMRRAMLGLVTTGHFGHPSDTYSLYDEVRSEAVHGEEPPEVHSRDLDGFAWDVRTALNEYLAYARAEGFTRRKHVRRALDTDERRVAVAETLVAEDPNRWREYLAPPVASGPTWESEC